MPADPHEAEDEVHAVVEQLGVGEHLPRGLGQRALVAHDAHQVDAFHHYLWWVDFV